MATPGEVRRAVGALTDRQEADIRAAYAKLSARIGDDPIRTRNALAAVLPAIGDTYGSAASALAADVYDDSRDAAGVVDKRGKRFRAKAAPLAGQERYDALAGWAVGPLFGGDPDPDAVVSKVVGGMQRTTADAFRETIIDNTRRDPNAIGWRRIGHGATCDFCRMLINRGAVYTEATVGFRAHDNCKCTSAAAFMGEDIGPLPLDQAITDETPSAIEAVAAPVWDKDRVRQLLNAELDTELSEAFNRNDAATIDLLSDEMEKREKWSNDWGRQYAEYDELVEQDRSWSIGAADDIADIPPVESLPEPKMSKAELRATWDEEQWARVWEAEEYGGGIKPEFRVEAESRGITLHTLMTGDPRIAYRYANQELLHWWDDHGGRFPFYEVEAKANKISTAQLAKRRATENRSRALAQEILGKDPAEAMRLRRAEQAKNWRAREARKSPAQRATEARERERRRYAKLLKAAGPSE